MNMGSISKSRSSGSWGISSSFTVYWPGYSEEVVANWDTSWSLLYILYDAIFLLSDIVKFKVASWEIISSVLSVFFLQDVIQKTLIRARSSYFFIGSRYQFFRELPKAWWFTKTILFIRVRAAKFVPKAYLNTYSIAWSVVFSKRVKCHKISSICFDMKI